MPILKVTGLSKSFTVAGNPQPVLQNLNLEIEQGEILMLLGPSGSGKSSLLNLLAGVDQPDSGQISILNQNITALNEAGRTRFRREHIGVVYQFFNLIPTLTVMENILLPLSLNGRLAERMQAEQQLALMGLADKQDRFPEQLSGGEQQRVAICRALVHKPALLLADEPTGSLDNDTADQVLALMLEKIRQEQMTLIMVTHSDALIEHADRVLRLHRGVLEQVA
ncbi:ABC transporter ATP-binding protein [Pontibacterium sp. N1Y112]|uniref:ABC transporter ATP-binding protein n=1 Tax=Pontibacterium sinense TaxID=2781979 RepID=A0A8J7FUF5_9GAMM|nr:ABC transporter ATP-binding protein [Pontibacterium sinense]MBE9397545.1 ABC transporter ATP-binding protein [Pontibacterium sinense]